MEVIRDKDMTATGSEQNPDRDLLARRVSLLLIRIDYIRYTKGYKESSCHGELNVEKMVKSFVAT